ncbi:hypothetical protein [Mesorhizobium sp.]|uniref:hypothetical protein n=1 Tax=Mesorhizobium sp. TaxID=1871066 RepID=UPI000FE6F631|nr:hypothetical protein [Mesorhizobium sp.]RWA85912.1 MAG: hypothetical protein EOQ30_03775 [Mesorhizobium sp.]
MDRPPDRPPATPQPSPQRSQIANGSATLLGGKDERSLYVRRMKEVIAEHVEDRGGLDAMSAAEKSLIRRVAVMTIELEKLETRFAEDPTVGERTLDLYNRTAGNLGRILERLGLKRKEKPPRTIQGHLAAKRRASA